MKYTRLTKEQFVELHQEFSTFLASQSITADQWKKIKNEKPNLAEEQLDVFSDLIWEEVLSKVNYLENNTANQLSLFKIETTKINLIVVKTTSSNIDLLTIDGLQWLEKNIASNNVDLLTGSKNFSLDKHKDIFNLIRQGCVITQGDLFDSLQKTLHLNF